MGVVGAKTSSYTITSNSFPYLRQLHLAARFELVFIVHFPQLALLKDLLLVPQVRGSRRKPFPANQPDARLFRVLPLF